jgi:hypothetical protein
MPCGSACLDARPLTQLGRSEKHASKVRWHTDQAAPAVDEDLPSRRKRQRHRNDPDAVSGAKKRKNAAPAVATQYAS